MELCHLERQISATDKDFFGIKIPMSKPILDAKSIDFGDLFPILNVRSKNFSDLPNFARLTDVNGCAPGPTFHAPDTRMT